MTLYDHVPASLGPDLLTKAKDEKVSYEEYCSVVADAALNQRRALAEAQARSNSRTSPTHSTEPELQELRDLPIPGSNA